MTLSALPRHLKAAAMSMQQTTMPRRRRPSGLAYFSHGLWRVFVAGCVAGQIAWRVFG